MQKQQKQWFYCVLAYSECSGVTLANVWRAASAQVLRWLMFGAQSYSDDVAGDMAGDIPASWPATAPQLEGIVSGSACGIRGAEAISTSKNP